MDMSADAAADTADFDGWGMATYNDKIYARPWILGTRVLFANRDLLNRAGYDTAFFPINWDDLKKAAFKIDSLGKEIYGWGSNAPKSTASIKNISLSSGPPEPRFSPTTASSACCRRTGR